MLSTGMLHPVGGAMGMTCHCLKRGYTLFDIISLNIHKKTSRCLCTLTSTADFCLLGKLFYSSSKGQYSVVIYSNIQILFCDQCHRAALVQIEVILNSSDTITYRQKLMLLAKIKVQCTVL